VWLDEGPVQQPPDSVHAGGETAIPLYLAIGRICRHECRVTLGFAAPEIAKNLQPWP